jgi:PTH1 family peptidyl-tRNA hydrolase
MTGALPENQTAWVLAGLGNPGVSYQNTRHNAGFLFLDALALFWGLEWKSSMRFRGEWIRTRREGVEVFLIKPQTFMNASGRCLQSFLSHWKMKPEQMVVLHDDINLDFGRFKLSMGGGDGGHNGIRDIREKLGEAFVRFRIGIGARSDRNVELKDYVLSEFDAAEREQLSSRMANFRDSIGVLLRSGPVLAMNSINQNKT